MSRQLARGGWWCPASSSGASGGVLAARQGGRWWTMVDYCGNLDENCDVGKSGVVGKAAVV